MSYPAKAEGLGKYDDNIINEFEHQPRYYAHLRTDKPQEKYESPFLPSNGLNSTTTFFFYKVGLGIQ